MRSEQQSSNTMMQRGIYIVAAIAAIASFVGLALDTARFFNFYAVAFLTWSGVSIGCLGLVMLNRLVDARWMYALQRFAEAGARTLPLLAILFLPMIFGLDNIYEWVGDGSKLEGGKAWMLQPAFFIVRTYIYIIIWSALAWYLTRVSYQSDESSGITPQQRDHWRNVSAVGVVIYMLTTTLAAFDWSMSITPEFFSSAWGWLMLSSQVLTTSSFLMLALAMYWNREPVSRAANQRAYDDFSVILLITLLVWVYMQGTGFVIIWQGNVAYNVEWYTVRNSGSWLGYTVLFAGLHAAAVLALLTPGVKRSRSLMVAIAALLLVLRVMEMIWVVIPPHFENFTLLPWDLGPVLAIGGVWFWFWSYLLHDKPLVPAHHAALAHDDVQTVRHNYDAADQAL